MVSLQFPKVVCLIGCEVMDPLFLGLAIVSFVCSGVFTWMITSFLSKRGVKINFWLLRYRMLGYLRQYREITTQESGTTGNLFYGYIVSFGLGILFIVLGAIL